MTNFNFAVTSGVFAKFEPSIAANLLLPQVMIAVAVDTTSGTPRPDFTAPLTEELTGHRLHCRCLRGSPELKLPLSLTGFRIPL